MDNLKYILLGILLLVGAYGAGYYFAPDKIKTVEKIVEKIVKEKDEKVTKEYDPNTGKLTKETHETKEKDTNSNETDKTTEKSKIQKTYALKGGVSVNPRDLNAKPVPRLGAEVRLPIFNSWLGVEGDVNIDRPLVGGYLRVEF